MGVYEYVLVAGAAAALAFGFFQVPRLIAYVVFLVVGAWPSYTLGMKNGWSFATVVIMVVIISAVYAALYWLAGRLSRRRI